MHKVIHGDNVKSTPVCFRQRVQLVVHQGRALDGDLELVFQTLARRVRNQREAALAQALGTVRISMGRGNTEEAMRRLAKELQAVVAKQKALA